jgi:hypothetical protein
MLPKSHICIMQAHLQMEANIKKSSIQSPGVGQVAGLMAVSRRRIKSAAKYGAPTTDGE